jgi:hypothetical protein
VLGDLEDADALHDCCHDPSLSTDSMTELLGDAHTERPSNGD